ncbi:MAG: Cthe_2314 family HEPN domain-containing protein [Pseudomonadota bacterium]
MDLGIVAYHFESYEDLSQHHDCRYAFDVENSVGLLSRRFESLNLVGDLLWPEPFPTNFQDFPISRYNWVNIAADVFLMRYISIVDCLLLVCNEVYEIGFTPKNCTFTKLKTQLPASIIVTIQDLYNSQTQLRKERNSRVHHGLERAFTDDDQTFRMASRIEEISGRVQGTDQFGREIDLDRSFKEALVELQRDFNKECRKLIRQLNNAYDELHREFEDRFIPRIRASTHGLNS